MSEAGEDEPWRLGKVVHGQKINVRMWKGGGQGRSPSLSPSGKARLARIVARTPEVTVKITGRSRNGPHLKKHLDYITRHGQLSAITQNGQTIHSRSELRGMHDAWVTSNDLDQAARRRPQDAHSVNMVLSMPPGTDRDKLEVAARSWATETFKGTHDWVMVRHDDTKHPHCHITVRAVGYNGKRLAPGPADLQSWRSGFASQLRRQGVPAEATPRQARGVTRRPLNLPAQKMEEKRKALPAADRAKPAPKPTFRKSGMTPQKWTATIEGRGQNIERAYLAHAEALSLGDAADRQLAKDIVRFVENLPVAKARRQAMTDELKAVVSAHPGSTQAPATKIDNRPPSPPRSLNQEPKPPAPSAPRPKGPRR